MDMSHEDNLLKSATRWQKRPPVTWRRAGETAEIFLRRNQRDLNRNAAIVDAWDSIIPPGLKPHCRLDRRVGGQLTVQATPGPYMHQLQMMQRELLDELNHRCRTDIQKLRIVPMNDAIEE